MADKSFGVKELNLLNASGTPTVTSPNNLNLNANTVAISTSCTIGSNLDVDGTTNLDNTDIVGITTIRNASGTKLYEGVANGSKLFHAGTERLSTELYGIDINGTLGADQINCSGVSTITVPANTNPHSSWDVVNNSASAYRFTGPGQDGAEDNPNIYLVRGQRYVFKMNASGHPFQIRVANGGAAYSDGVTNNGSQTGNVVFNVQHDAPAQLYYQCTSHGSMVGNIYIIGGSQVISGVVTATTFVGNLTGNVTGTASGNAVLTGSTNDQLVTVTGANAITGESALTYTNNILKNEVSDASGLAAHILVNNSESSAGVSLLGSGSSFSSGGWAPVTDAAHIRSSAGAANGLVLQASAGDMRFYVDGSPTERVRITSDGTKEFKNHGGGTIKVSGSSAHTSKIVIADNGGTANGNCLIEGGDGTDFFTIQSNGNVAFENGKGINFGDTAGSGATSSIFDDYEEGSWTPASKNAGSFTSPTGRYVKIGEVVTVWGYIPTMTDITSTSNLEISGLPYSATSTAHTEFVGSVMMRFQSVTSQNGANFTTYQASGWNYLRIYASRDDGNNYEAAKHEDWNFTSAGIRFCHSYTV